LQRRNVVDLTYRDLPVGQWADHKQGWDTRLAMRTEPAHS